MHGETACLKFIPQDVFIICFARHLFVHCLFVALFGQPQLDGVSFAFICLRRRYCALHTRLHSRTYCASLDIVPVVTVLLLNYSLAT